MQDGVIGFKELTDVYKELLNKSDSDMSRQAEAERQKILFDAEKSLRFYSEKEIKNAIIAIHGSNYGSIHAVTILQVLKDHHFSINDLYTEETVLKFVEKLGVNVTDEVKSMLRNIKEEI